MKYNSQFTDLDALQRELGGLPPEIVVGSDADDDEDDGSDDEDSAYQDRWTGTSH